MRMIVWSGDAVHDFEAAIAHIRRESRKDSLLVADRIEHAVNNVADMPTGRPGRVAGTYEKVVRRTPYILAYALTERRVTILRVIHGSRDWSEGGWPT